MTKKLCLDNPNLDPELVELLLDEESTLPLAELK